MSKNVNICDIRPFLLNRSEAARFLGIGLSTLSKLDIPKTTIKKRVLYSQSTLETWVRLHTVKP